MDRTIACPITSLNGYVDRQRSDRERDGVFLTSGHQAHLEVRVVFLAKH
jgi:hypothetical protein